MEDIKTIDVMNYPHTCMLGLVDFSKWGEFGAMARSTFKTLFPAGRMPTPEEMKASPVGSVGTQFNPYPSVEAMIKDIDELGYDKVVITDFKIWSYRLHFQLIWDFGIDVINDILQKSSGRVIAGASYNPFRIEESLREIEKAVKEYGFKYVCFHPITFGMSPNDRRCYPLYAKCNELGIPVGIQVGHSAEPLPSIVGHPMEVDDVALNFPNLRINLSHTGWPWIDEWCSMVWKHENVYGDISSYMPRSLDAALVRFMDRRGRNKVLFGTNGMGLKVCKEQFMALDIRDENKKAILHDNAMEFFNL